MDLSPFQYHIRILSNENLLPVTTEVYLCNIYSEKLSVSLRCIPRQYESFTELTFYFISHACTLLNET